MILILFFLSFSNKAFSFSICSIFTANFFLFFIKISFSFSACLFELWRCFSFSFNSSKFFCFVFNSLFKSLIFGSYILLIFSEIFCLRFSDILFFIVSFFQRWKYFCFFLRINDLYIWKTLLQAILIFDKINIFLRFIFDVL